jgi:hypothetical protein
MVNEYLPFETALASVNRRWTIQEKIKDQNIFFKYPALNVFTKTLQLKPLSDISNLETLSLRLSVTLVDAENIRLMITGRCWQVLARALRPVL